MNSGKEIKLVYKKIIAPPQIITPEVAERKTLTNRIEKRTPDQAVCQEIEVVPEIIEGKNVKKRKKYTCSFKAQALTGFTDMNVPDFIFRDNSLNNIKYSDRAHGFFSNSISYIQEDDHGFIWLASVKDGLCRFDGHLMRIFTHSSGLPSDIVYSIFHDSQDRIWLATNKGFCFIQEDSIYLPVCDEKFKSHTTRITEDSQGNTWISTKYQGALKYNKHVLEVFNRESGLQGNYVDQVLIAKNKDVWFAMVDGGFSRFDGKNYYRYLYQEGSVNIPGISLFEENNGGIWLGRFDRELIRFYDGKFIQYDLVPNQVERIFDIQENEHGLWISVYGKCLINLQDSVLRRFAVEDGLPDKSVFRTYIDHNYNIWIAFLYGGVARLEENCFQANNPLTGIPMNLPSRIRMDKSGNTWYLPNGEQLIKEDKSSYTLYSNSGDERIQNERYIWDICFQAEDTLWAATYADGIVRITNQEYTFYRFEKGNRILGMGKDKLENMWFNRYQFGLLYYDGHSFYEFTTKQGLSSNYVNLIFADSKGKIWVGYENEGLDIINGELIAHFDMADGLSSNKINAIYEDRDGNIWIGTDKGIDIISKGKILHLGQQNGIISDKVTLILQDSSYCYWIGTDIGVSRICEGSDQKFQIRNFGKQYGLRVNDFIHGTVKDNNTILWVTNDGILTYRREYERKKGNLPLFDIPNIHVHRSDDVRINSAKDKLVVSAGGILKLELLAIDWGYENELKYAYSLSRKSDNINWIDLKSEKNLSFQKTRPGKYQLLIRAQNKYGSSDPVVMEVEFLPFWWQSLLFRIILLLLISALVIYIFYARKRQFQKRETELEKIIYEKTLEIINEKEELKEANLELEKQNKLKQALMQEIHHRVKNNLQMVTSIIDLQRTNVKGNLKGNEDDQSALANIQIRINSISMVHDLLYTRDDLINISVKEYLDKLVYSTLEIMDHSIYNLSVSSFIDDIQLNITDCIIIGLLTSEAISNALKHAFININKPFIKLTLKKDAEKELLYYEIRDNGRGYAVDPEKNKYKSLGMKLIRIYAKQLNADLEIGNENGAIIRISIPFKSLKTDIS